MEMRDKVRACFGVSPIDANDLYLSKILDHGLPLLQETSQQPSSSDLSPYAFIEPGSLDLASRKNVGWSEAIRPAGQRFPR